MYSQSYATLYTIIYIILVPSDISCTRALMHSCTRVYVYSCTHVLLVKGRDDLFPVYSCTRSHRVLVHSFTLGTRVLVHIE